MVQAGGSVPPCNFVDERALRGFLEARDVPLHRWGHGDAKRVSDLLDELREGDCVLESHTSERRVSIAVGLIRRPGGDDRILLELEQVLDDGRVRRRLQPFGEKVKTEEAPLEAIARGMREELGLKPGEYTVLPKHRKATERTESPSYPGVVSVYERHTFEIRTTVLPDGDFWREDRSQDATPAVRHRWGWREAPARYT